MNENATKDRIRSIEVKKAVYSMFEKAILDVENHIESLNSDIQRYQTRIIENGEDSWYTEQIALASHEISIMNDALAMFVDIVDGVAI